MVLLLKWLVMTVSIGIAAHLIPGVTVNGFLAALWVALILGVVNVLIRPILILVTLPINILTLGFFTFIINGALVLLVSAIVKGFEVKDFLTALIFSIVVSVINYLLNGIVHLLQRERLR